MTPDHANRSHSVWSASSSEGNFCCPGRLAMTMGLPESTSEAADWGTCCHEISDACLRDGSDADRFIGVTLKGKKYSFEVDDEMAETAQVYIDYCRKRLADYAAETGDAAVSWVEQHFDLAEVNPPFEAGGTGDFVAFFPLWKALEVVDLKGGRGVVVEAKGNKQARTYGLGALVANKGLAVEKVTVTIVQPRAPHPSGRIRSETLDVTELLDWTVDMLAAMRKSKEALDAKPDLAPAAWAAAYLRPGSHCGSTFCKAAAFCPALEQAAMDAMGAWFDPQDNLHLSNVPEQTDPAERTRRLDALDMIEDWVKQVRAHEHWLAEGGDPAPGYGLVQKVGREKWNEGAEDKVLYIAEMAGLPDAKIRNPGKLMTPKQVRKALKDDARLLDGLSSTPISGTNLVKLGGSTRQEIASPISAMFKTEA